MIEDSFNKYLKSVSYNMYIMCIATLKEYLKNIYEHFKIGTYPIYYFLKQNRKKYRELCLVNPIFIQK